MKRAEKDRLSLEGQLERAKQLFLLGDLSETKYLQEKARIEQALAKLQSPAQPALDLQEAIRLLQTYGGVLEQATDAEKKAFFATVLNEVFVRNRKIAAIRPKPNYYDLLSMSDVRPNGVRPPTHKLVSGYYHPRPRLKVNKSLNHQVIISKAFFAR